MRRRRRVGVGRPDGGIPRSGTAGARARQRRAGIRRRSGCDAPSARHRGGGGHRTRRRSRRRRAPDRCDAEPREDPAVSRATAAALDWVEQGLVPDAVIRGAIRRLCARRLREIDAGDCEASARSAEAFVHAMDASDVAPLPQIANEQHYEVPAQFFATVLGPHRKYSCAWWPPGASDLAQAEARALEATCERADLADGHSILELGCGWGSLTLWMAQRFPGSRITAVSNSRSQRY